MFKTRQLLNNQHTVFYDEILGDPEATERAVLYSNRSKFNTPNLYGLIRSAVKMILRSNQSSNPVI